MLNPILYNNNGKRRKNIENDTEIPTNNIITPAEAKAKELEENAIAEAEAQEIINSEEEKAVKVAIKELKNVKHEIILSENVLNQSNMQKILGGAHSKKNNRITKRRGGGAIIQTLAKTGKTFAEALAIGIFGSSKLTKQATGATVNAASATIITGDAAVQGSLAVITAVFNTLISIFIKLPDDFDGIVAELNTASNLTKKQKLAKKLIHLFKKIIKILVRSFKAILKEYAIFNREVKNKNALVMNLVGCRRTLINKVFRDTNAHTCKLMNSATKQKVDKILKKIQFQLVFIKRTLETNIDKVKARSKTKLSELKISLAVMSGDVKLFGFMEEYKKAINPIIEESRKLLSLENNIDIIRLMNELNEILKSQNALENSPINAPVNPLLNAQVSAPANAPVNPLLNAPVNTMLSIKNGIRRRVGESLKEVFSRTNSAEEEKELMGGRKSTKYHMNKSRRRR